MHISSVKWKPKYAGGSDWNSLFMPFWLLPLLIIRLAISYSNAHKSTRNANDLKEANAFPLKQASKENESMRSITGNNKTKTIKSPTLSSKSCTNFALSIHDTKEVPISGRKGKKGTISYRLFWELAYCWQNLFKFNSCQFHLLLYLNVEVPMIIFS